MNDLYEEELSQWLKLKAMTVSERRKFYSERDGSAVSERVGALSQESFKMYPNRINLCVMFTSLIVLYYHT